MKEGDKIVMIDEKEYVLRKISIADKIEIQNNTVDISGNLKIGTMQLKMVVASLVSWNYTDMNGNMIPPTEQNILKHLPVDHFDKLAGEAIKLNELLQMEKKTLLEKPAMDLDGQNGTITGKNLEQSEKQEVK